MLQAVQTEYELDIGAAVKDLFNKDDFVASNRLMRRRSPEEIALIQQQQAQVAQQQAQQAQDEQAVENNEPLTPQELNNTLKQMEKKAPNGAAQQVRV